MDGWPFRTRLCARPEISSESNSVQTLRKFFGWDYLNQGPPCVYASKKKKKKKKKKQSHTHVKDPGQSTSEFGGLWKQQNNPAGTKMTVMASFRGRWSLAEDEEPFCNMLLFSFCVWIIQLFCYSSASFSPTAWYNCTGWLGRKHQVTYLSYTLIQQIVFFIIHNSPLLVLVFTNMLLVPQDFWWLSTCKEL